eukprot:9164457-Pyramimonas_sp.AAC.2
MTVSRAGESLKGLPSARSSLHFLPLPSRIDVLPRLPMTSSAGLGVALRSRGGDRGGLGSSFP